ncbi:UNVERIFIED_CONTAM: hypothetical protein Slati_1446200 [Sesamum latifolium]|uniref:Integrase catalytic domain-containing protein n=1 Tax=Sesamum latifolium TaxID=2727402 RepID=A0AAW2X521_9LAMI
MDKDCLEYAKKCESCQLHANFIHQPPKPLHPTITSWSFDAWGLDVVGPITPKSSIWHIYILTTTNYFSKWAEAVPLKEVKKETVVDFIRVNIIFRYGVPRYIINDMEDLSTTNRWTNYVRSSASNNITLQCKMQR